MSIHLLPDSRLKSSKASKRCIWQNGQVLNVVDFYCANCGKYGGYCPEENMTFMFWMCDPCFEKFPLIEGTFVVPDELFWKKVNEAQMEEYGRLLTAEEIAIELQNPNSVLSKLKKEGTPNAICI